MKTRITSSIITAAASLILACTAAVNVHAGTPCGLVVDNTNDSGPGSLRDAVEICAAPGQTITFNTNGVFAVPQTILLTTGEIVINKNLTIRGPGANRVSVSGNHISRVFNVSETAGPAIAAALPMGLNVTIVGLTITNGFHSNSGGGIYND